MYVLKPSRFLRPYLFGHWLSLCFQGADTIGEMRGAPEHLAGTIAMPFMIGPGTISAAVVTGIECQLVRQL